MVWLVFAAARARQARVQLRSSHHNNGRRVLAAAQTLDPAPLLVVTRSAAGIHVEPAPVEQLENLKVVELQALLAQLQLPKSGRKVQLVERLRSALAAAASSAASNAGNSVANSETSRVPSSTARLGSADGGRAGVDDEPSSRVGASAGAHLLALLPQEAQLQLAEALAAAQGPGEDQEHGRPMLTSAPAPARGSAAAPQTSASAIDPAALATATATAGAAAAAAEWPAPPLPAAISAPAVASEVVTPRSDAAAVQLPHELPRSTRQSRVRARRSPALPSPQAQLPASFSSQLPRLPMALPASASQTQAQQEQQGRQQQHQQEVEEEEEEEEEEGRPIQQNSSIGQQPQPPISEQRAEAPWQQEVQPISQYDAGGGGAEGGLAPGLDIDLTELPPMPPLQRGSCWLVQDKQLDENELKTLLQSNPSELQVAVLGSAGHSAGRYRALPSLVLLRGKDAWVFDAGDDTQRQLGAMAHVRPSKVFRLFMTSLTSESVAGLPGLLCTIGQARVRGHETTDIPIHVYGPPGLANFLANIYMVSHTYLEVAIVVHELVSVAVPDQDRQPEQINRRARIFTTQLPPDQLNPEGATDACLAAFKPTQGRAVTAKGSKAGGGVLAFDSRAAYLPFPDPQPGDPERAPPPHHQLRWTLQIDVGAQVVAVALPSPQPDSPRFAFVIQARPGSVPYLGEADRSGALVVERAQALGIPPGRAYSELKEGRAVQNLVGQTIPPELCVSPKRPGRRVVIMSTCHALPPRDAAFWDAAQDADLLVTGTVLPDELVLPRGLELSNDKKKSNISGAVMHNVSNSNGANSTAAAVAVAAAATAAAAWRAAGELHGPDTPPAVDALIPTMLRQALRQAVATTAAAGTGRRADEGVAGFAAGEDFHVLVLDKNL
ncbi:hypothetical protein QJQ45_025846 [Haematococcus lacustris]|nr:hypothetical protein QJQ45_025846 [Haematococcus lacustris]